MARDWSVEIKWAERGLGIKSFVSATDNPTCFNARYVLTQCDNVNLDDDGFCQFCDRHHWIVRFGQVWKSGARRIDQGCASFGNIPESEYMATDIMLGHDLKYAPDQFSHLRPECRKTMLRIQDYILGD